MKVKECLLPFWQNITLFWNTFIATYEGVATLLLFFVIALKLHTNRKAESIDYKQMIVSIPGEILFLVLGFQISSMIEKGSHDNTQEYLAKFFILLLLLHIQYTIERWSEDKLSGDLSINVKFVILFMYLVSILVYIATVYGGL